MANLCTRPGSKRSCSRHRQGSLQVATHDESEQKSSASVSLNIRPLSARVDTHRANRAAGNAAAAASLLRRSSSASPKIYANSPSEVDSLPASHESWARKSSMPKESHLPDSRCAKSASEKRPPLPAAVGKPALSGQAMACTATNRGRTNSSEFDTQVPIAEQNIARPVALLHGSGPVNNNVAKLLKQSSAQGSRNNQAHDAELALLRARFNLRLDVERVRTEDGATELRDACSDAIKIHQNATAEQIDGMRRGFEHTLAVQRSAEEVALGEVHAESAEVQLALRSEISSWKHANMETNRQLQEARAWAEEMAAEAAIERDERLRSYCQQQARWEEEMAQAHVTFRQQQEQTIHEVIARFEHDHFHLSMEVASAVDKKHCAEKNLEEVRAQLEGLRDHACDLWPEDDQVMPLQKGPTSFSSQGVQTEDFPTCTEVPPPSPGYEQLALRLADAEASILHATNAEAARLAVVDERMRRTVALKNDVIDELKDELWCKEREILETRGILAGRDANSW